MADSCEIQSYLQDINPYEFESLIADPWEERGYETKVTTATQDRGIDVIAKQYDPICLKVLIQAKAYSETNTIGSGEVRKYSTLYQQEDDVDRVVIVTSSSFTTQAEELGNDLGVELIDRENLKSLIKGSNLTLPTENNGGSKRTQKEESINKSADTSKSSVESEESAINWKEISTTNYDLRKQVSLYAEDGQVFGIIENKITPEDLYAALEFHLQEMNFRAGEMDFGSRETVSVELESVQPGEHADNEIAYKEGLYYIYSDETEVIQKSKKVFDEWPELTESYSESGVITYTYDTGYDLDIITEISHINSILQDVYESGIGDISSIVLESEVFEKWRKEIDVNEVTSPDIQSAYTSSTAVPSEQEILECASEAVSPQEFNTEKIQQINGNYCITESLTIKKLYEAVDFHLRTSEYTAGKNGYKADSGFSLYFDTEPGSQNDSSEFLTYINGLYLVSSDDQDVAHCAESRFSKLEDLTITRNSTCSEQTNTWATIAVYNKGRELYSHVETKHLIDLVISCYGRDIEEISYIDINPNDI